MNFKEAFLSMRGGEKISSPQYKTDYYLYIKDNVVMSSYGRPMLPLKPEVDNDDWFIWSADIVLIRLLKKCYATLKQEQDKELMNEIENILDVR